MIPVPKSDLGEFEWEYPDLISILVGETNRTDYEEYILACKNAGFENLDSKAKNDYNATNAEGYRLSLTYIEDRQEMRIVVKEPLVDVTIIVDCNNNLIFNKYDVDLYASWKSLGTLTHGDEGKYDVGLEPGSHTLQAEHTDDWDICGELKFNVEGPSTLYFEITCEKESISIKQVFPNDSVTQSEEDTSSTPNDSTTKENTEDTQVQEAEEVKEIIPEKILADNEVMLDEPAYHYEYENYEEVKEELKNIGFTNIELVPVYDLSTGWLDSTSVDDVDEISINGNSDFEEGAIFKKDAKVVITYHQYEILNPNNVYEKYTVDSMINDLDDNAMRAKQTYLNKLVEVTGRVDHIDDNGDFMMYPVNNKWAIQGVSCSLMTDEQKDQVMNISKGDVISVCGEIALVGDFIAYNLEVHKIM